MDICGAIHAIPLLRKIGMFCSILEVAFILSICINSNYLHPYYPNKKKPSIRSIFEGKCEHQFIDIHYCFKTE